MDVRDLSWTKLHHVSGQVAWLRLPWEAQALWPQVQMRLDRAGELDLGGEEVVEALLLLLTARTPWPREMVESGLKALCAAGLLLLRDEGRVLVDPRYAERQQMTKSAAQRKREQRAREAAEQRSIEGIEPVAQHGVTSIAQHIDGRFDDWWDRGVGRGNKREKVRARRWFEKRLKAGVLPDQDQLVRVTRAYYASVEDRSVKWRKLPSTVLEDKIWEDEVYQKGQGGGWSRLEKS